MPESPEQHLVAAFRKYGEAVARGIITGPEFTNAAFSRFADTEGVSPEVIPMLWAVIPGDIRDEFAAAVQRAVGPGFRFRELFFGPGWQLPEDEERRVIDLRTARVQAWAAAFVQWRGGSGGESGYQPRDT